MDPTGVVKDNEPASSQSNSSDPTMLNEQLLLLETYTNPTNDSIRHLIDLFKSYKFQRSKGKDWYKNDSAFADAYETRGNVQKV